MRYKNFDDSIIKDRQKRLWGQDETPLLIMIFLAVYLFIAQIVPAYLLVPVNVVGTSMEPTLYNGDRVILFKQGDIGYGDIVVIYAPDLRNQITGEMGEDIIKRVMGLPGDTLWFEKKTVNGSQHIILHRQRTEKGMEVETSIYNESYILKDESGSPIYGNNYPQVKIKLGEDEFFVLGDNRAWSKDSRFPDVGKIKKNFIIGKVLVIIRDNVPILFEKINY